VRRPDVEEGAWHAVWATLWAAMGESESNFRGGDVGRKGRRERGRRDGRVKLMRASFNSFAPLFTGEETLAELHEDITLTSPTLDPESRLTVIQSRATRVRLIPPLFPSFLLPRNLVSSSSDIIVPFPSLFYSPLFFLPRFPTARPLRLLPKSPHPPLPPFLHRLPLSPPVPLLGHLRMGSPPASGQKKGPEGCVGVLGCREEWEGRERRGRRGGRRERESGR